MACEILLKASDNVQAKINAQPPGTRFLFTSETFSNLTIIPRDGDTYHGSPGTILNGGGITQFAFRGHNGSSWVNDVTVENLRVTNYKPPAQNGALWLGNDRLPDCTNNWILYRLEVDNNINFAVRIGSGTKVFNSHLHHNSTLNIGGVGSDVLIDTCEINHGNASLANDPGFESGGTKFVKTLRLTVQNSNIHDNGGPGLWMDINNIDYDLKNNTVSANAREGIVTEISAGGIIHGNTITGNGTGDPFRPQGYLWNAGIGVHASRDVEIYNNILSGNFNGIVAIQQNRGAANGDPPEEFGPYIVINMDVHDNTVTQNVPQAGGLLNLAGGAACDFGDNSIFTSRNNLWTNNTYFLQNPAFQAFAWNNATRTPAAWQGFGHDLTGTFNY